ncbi:hypothetical protein C0Q70_10970 [Pomacea canaliculata]|uniref:CCHC-type domain-containing protein n=1 Tax=Pomacea canaliculata TaxID=400727 RepID=A0A2T7P4Q8_POMCA|nr:hypothetical protein C0Q70_10970 [Pomacea canaliculata]
MPSLYSQIVTGGNDTTSATRPPGGFIPLSEVGVVSFTLNYEHIDDLLKRSTFQLHLSGRHALLTRREAIVAVLIASGVPKAEITEREEDGSDKGTRYLKVEMQRKNMGKIPTMIAVPGHTLNMLVTVKGRASTCLVCGRPGHTRRDCPDVRKQYRPATGPTGHSKTTPGRDDKGPSTTPTLTVLGKVQAKPASRAQNQRSVGTGLDVEEDLFVDSENDVCGKIPHDKDIKQGFITKHCTNTPRSAVTGCFGCRYSGLTCAMLLRREEREDTNPVPTDLCSKPFEPARRIYSRPPTQPAKKASTPTTTPTSPSTLTAHPYHDKPPPGRLHYNTSRSAINAAPEGLCA